MSRFGHAASVKSLGLTIAFVFLFVVAMLLDLPYLYLMAVTIAVLPLASYGLAWFFASQYVAKREHASTGREGRRLTVHLKVTAKGGLPQTAIRVGDILPEALVRQEEAQALPPDWDGRQGTREYTIIPEVRGVFTLGPTKLEMSDPLGLFPFEAEIGEATEIVVHPTPLFSRGSVSGGAGVWGVRERDGNTRRGEGMEFHGVREYRPGDPLRRVHWRTSARTGRLAVVEYERAYQQNLILALDLSKDSVFGKGRETTLEYGIKIAATLAERTLTAGGGVTLLSQNFRLDVQPREGDSVGAHFRLMDLLARAQADSDVALSETLRAARLAPGGRLAILTSGGDDLLSGYLMDRLRYNDSVTVYFLEPTSFGGPARQTPAVPKAGLRLVERQHSPWAEGGKHMEFLLRDDI
ncbi:MAG: DUF58 domain-containing protein [Armatimonas sp.]